jgi:hypothetical protein
LKPGILAAGVIGNEIDDDVDPALMRFGHQIPKIIVRPVTRIHVVIVDDIVPVITHRLVDRHQPDAVGAEAPCAAGLSIVDVVEAGSEAAQITDAVAVRIVERSNEHLVANSAAPPVARTVRGNSGLASD